jgi:hypothetical protein
VNDPLLDAESELRGLRFLDDETERLYREWATRNAAPFVRSGMVASAIAWVLAGGAIGYAVPQAFAWLKPGLGLIAAALVIAYGLTRTKWSQAVFPATAAANAIAGTLLALTALHGLDPLMGVAGVVQVNYFAFTVFKLPVRWAVPAAATYIVLFLVLVWGDAFAQPLGSGNQILYSMGLVNAFVTGTLAGVILERTSRETFSQQRRLAEQRATIDSLQKAEIAHQVAERSKQLGEVLANVQGALPATAHLEPGRRFADRYEIVKELGRGGMGAVYEVERTTDRRRLALKVVTGHVTGAQAARFAREAEIGARVRHSNLVQIVDVGVSSAGAPFLVMELVPGGSLEDRRDRFGDETWARPVLAQIAQGLAALHAAGVVHRDLKPANVLVSGNDGMPLARISDFGISCFGAIEGGDPLGDTVEAGGGLKGQSLTRTGALIGTPLYMAPEAAAGAQAAGPAADVFAFGLIAYEMVSGRVPFAAPPVLEVMAGRAVPEPAPVAGALGTTIAACLSIDPAKRPSIDQLVATLG